VQTTFPILPVGYTRVGVARVASVEIGGQSLGRMTMRIGRPGIPYTLLGQPEIARLGRVTIENGVMTITRAGWRRRSQCAKSGWKSLILQ
jgi:hypothetical protein